MELSITASRTSAPYKCAIEIRCPRLMWRSGNNSFCKGEDTLTWGKFSGRVRFHPDFKKVKEVTE